MSLSTTLTHSKDAWSLLRGVVCLYKPSDYSGARLIAALKHKLISDLNQMERTVDSENKFTPLGDGEASSAITTKGTSEAVIFNKTGNGNTDYSVHPLVLGPGYHFDDLKVKVANKLADNVSGVLVVGINNGGVGLAEKLKSAKLLTTLEVKGEWGRATSTGWVGGKTRHCRTWQHLVGRPWLVDQCLSAVQASHQARAWNVSNLSLVSQEAYEKALEGPVKPSIMSETLVYSIKVKEWNPPYFMMEVQCVEQPNDKQAFVVRLVEEIAVKCRTVAHCHGIRCSNVGPFISSGCLLPKYISLQNVLNNISDNRKLMRQIWPKGVTTSKTGFNKKESDMDKSTSSSNQCNQFSQLL